MKEEGKEGERERDIRMCKDRYWIGHKFGSIPGRVP